MVICAMHLPKVKMLYDSTTINGFIGAKEGNFDPNMTHSRLGAFDNGIYVKSHKE